MKQRRIISIVLVVLGIVVLSIPYYNKYTLKKKMKEASIEEITPQQLKKNDEQVIAEEEFDFSKVEDISPSATFLNAGEIDQSLLIGQLVVPSVKMNMSIFKGSTNDNLLAGAATMKSSDSMGTGNFTLAGHYNKDKSILFGGLMDIKIGEIVRVTDKVSIYEYRVYATKVVEDTDVYMIEDEQSQQRGNPIISLMTCYYSSKTGKRYFVLGDLVNKYPYKKELMEGNRS